MQERRLDRGKRKDNGEWVYGQLLTNEYGSFIVSRFALENYGDEETDFYATEWYEVVPETVGRYIGIYDKNEKMIFESDIIGVFGYDYEEPSFDEYGEVICTSLGVGIYYTKTDGSTDMLLLSELQGSYLTEYTVFGNAHDNPELLIE